MKRLLVIFSLSLIPLQALAVTPDTTHILNRETSWYDPSDAGPKCETVSPSPSAALPADATLDQKIAQTFILGFDAGTPKATIEALFKKYRIGGMYITGTHNAAAAGFDAALYAKLDAAAGVPIVASSDEEGVVTRYSYPAASFPPAASMGANAEKIGTAAGIVMRKNGLTTDLAPVLDLRDVGTGLKGRSFSSNPTTVATQAEAFATGLDTSGITPIFKHFPGFDSTTKGSTDDVKVVMSGSIANTTAPYKALATKFPNAGVMMGNMYVTALDSANPTSLSAKSVSYLRSTIGFSGMVTTDDLAVKSVTAATGSLANSVTRSLAAGVSMPLFANPGDAGIQAIINKVKAGVTPAAIAAADAKVMSFKTGKTVTTNTAGSGGCCPSSDANSVAPTGNNPKDVWDNLRAQGFNPTQTAGIMGNMQSESGFDPLIIQGGGHSSDPAAAGGGGYGLVQWTPGSKLIPYLHGSKPNVPTEILALKEQLDGKGASGEKAAGAALIAAGTDLRKASDAFELLYERHAGSPQPARYSQAQAILTKYGSSTTAILNSANNISSILTCDNTLSATADPRTIFQDSSNIRCAPGTKDLGIADGYHKNILIKIRICAIPNLPNTGQESHNGFGVNGANGGSVVNSRVSGQVSAMATAMKKSGLNIIASSAFRTMAHQQSLCPCDAVTVALPGTSNHQMGLAIDFGGNLPSSPGPIPGNPLWAWLTKNAATYGYSNYPREAWHWSATGN